MFQIVGYDCRGGSRIVFLDPEIEGTMEGFASERDRDDVWGEGCWEE